MEVKIINMLDLLKKIHVNIRNNSQKNEIFKSNILFQAVELLHCKIISLVESTIILNRNYKYAESRMILRNIFETSVIILYFQQYPYESKRWLDWDNLSVADKEKIPKKYNDFVLYLSNNGYNQTIEIMTKSNHSFLRNFSPWFIREMAFRNLKQTGKDYSEFYNLVCKFSHPSFVSLMRNDRLDKQSKEDIEKTALFILFQSTTIFIDVLEEFVDVSIKKIFESAYSEIQLIFSEIEISSLEVKKHFVICQRSAGGNHAKFKEIALEVVKLDNEEIDKEIFNNWAGKPNEANNIFLCNTVKWYIRKVAIFEILNPYDNFRNKISFQPFSMNALRLIKAFNDEELQNDIKNANIEQIKQSLPIFVIEKDQILFCQDGWFRLLVLAYNNFTHVDAYVAKL